VSDLTDAELAKMERLLRNGNADLDADSYIRMARELLAEVTGSGDWSCRPQHLYDARSDYWAPITSGSGRIWRRHRNRTQSSGLAARG
jgi:hypothetical protein